MSLTPEDVVNKRFSPTKFREGYDQDEVDDFLDEVVLELRRLGQDNDELRQRMATADARGGAPAPAGPAVPSIAPVGGFEASPLDAGNTSNLLQLARRLHEEHVQEGIAKRDQLIAEGQAAVARAVAEAEAVMRAQNGTLVQERETLEKRIAELRSFENDYRRKLRSYIETQLRELGAASVLATPAQTAEPAPRAEQPAAQPQPAFAGAPAAQPEPAFQQAAPAPAQQPSAQPQQQPVRQAQPQPFGQPQPFAQPAQPFGGAAQPQPQQPYREPVGQPYGSAPQPPYTPAEPASAQTMSAQPSQAQPQAQPSQGAPIPGYQPGAMPQIPTGPLPQAPQPTGYQGLAGQ